MKIFKKVILIFLKHNCILTAWKSCQFLPENSSFNLKNVQFEFRFFALSLLRTMHNLI